MIKFSKNSPGLADFFSIFEEKILQLSSLKFCRILFDGFVRYPTFQHTTYEIKSMSSNRLILHEHVRLQNPQPLLYEL